MLATIFKFYETENGFEIATNINGEIFLDKKAAITHLNGYDVFRLPKGVETKDIDMAIDYILHKI